MVMKKLYSPYTIASIRCENLEILSPIGKCDEVFSFRLSFKLPFKIIRSCALKSLIPLIFIILGTLELKAADRYSVASGNWSSTSTWSTTSGGASGASVPVTGDNVYIEGGWTVTVDVANAGCQALLIEATSNYNTTSSIKFNSGSVLTVAGNVNLGLNGQRKGSIDMASGGLFRIGGTLTVAQLGTWIPGSGTIEYYGGSQTVYAYTYYNLILSGTGSKTFPSGTTTVNNILSIENGSYTNTFTGSLSYGTSATLQYNTPSPRIVSTEWPATFNSSGGVIIRNTGTITLNGSKSFSGPLTVYDGSSINNGGHSIGSPNALLLYCGGLSSGSSISGTGLLTLGGNVTVTDAGQGTAGATVSCPVDLGATRAFTVADGGSDPATDLTLSGIISGTGFGITKAGIGTMLLSGLNTFTGAVTINIGVLSADNLSNIGSNSALGTGSATGASAISIAGTGTLKYTGSGNSANRPIILTGNGAAIDASGTGTMTLSGTISGTYNLVLTGTTLGVASGYINTGAGTVTKTGSGTWTLTGNSTYSGLTTISSGTLKLGGGETSTPLGQTSAGTVVENGATLDLSGFTIQEPLTLNGNGVSSLGALINSTSYDSQCYGSISLGSSSTIGEGNINIGGGISGTGHTLTKLGNGIITISSQTTFSGSLIINGGVVQMAYAGCLNDDLSVTLNGGTLSTGGVNFDETLGVLTLSSSSFITLGEGSHSLTFANSSGATWNGTLTITGWTGNGLSGGTGGKIFVGTGGLTTTQLSQIIFEGFDPGANLLNGEVVPPYQHTPGDYRSVTTGNWNSLDTWVFYNGSGWVTPLTLPSGASLVQILNEHTVTVDAFAHASHVIIESGGILTLTSSGQGTFGTITNFGTLNLNSDAGGIFSLIVNTYSDFGNENIQLYLTGGGDETNYPWHYISTPVAGLSTSSVMTGGGDAGSDLVEYDETIVATSLSQHNAWMGYDGWDYQDEDYSAPGFGSLILGKGYNYYSYSNATRVFGGSFNTQDVTTFSLSNSGPGDNPDIFGWNLVGNPFTASINWDNIVTDGFVDDAIYFTTNNTTASYVAGIGVPSGTTGLIPPMQGFFVKSNGTEDYINFHAATRIHSNQNRYKGDSESIPLIRLKLVNQNVADETVIRFDKSANLEFDHNLDAYKFSKTGTKVSLWSNSDKINYSINSIPYPETEIEIPLGINVSEEGSFKLNATQIEGLGDYGIFLTDKTTGTSVNLRTSPEFSFSASAGINENRFVIKIINLTTNVEDPGISTDKFNIYPTSGFINIQTLSEEWNGKKGSVGIVDMTGRVISLENNMEFWKNSLIQIPAERLRGIYFIKLESGLLKHVGRVMIR